MNRNIRRLALVTLLLYGALFARLNLTQVVQASDHNRRPDNTRAVERDFNEPRGTIATADGRLVALSEETEGRFRYQRRYPLGDLFAHVAGSYSYLFGADGVERRYNDELAGRIPELQLEGFKNPFVKRDSSGNVVLTLRADVQEVAKQQLGERKGSVVALDPRSGGVLAMWSFPSYDPNLTASNDPEVARAARDLLRSNPEKPDLARAYRERYFPGSTFKVVTASAGLESGKVTDTAPVYPPARGYTPPLTNRPIRNFDGATCGGALLDILRVSCNSAFAQMGAETLGPQPMIGQAQKFGFGSAPPIDLPRAVPSVFPADFGARLRASETPGNADVFENTPALAQASIGQNDVSATPLQMALVVAAIANGGSIMTPHVLDRIEDPNGGVVERYEASVWRSPVSAETAATMRRAMVGVVASGTATRVAVPGLEVGAKTGTAQLGTDPPRSHAWLIAFAGRPGGPPEVAVAVVVEGQEGASEQTGGRVAAPIAREVIRKVMG